MLSRREKFLWPVYLQGFHLCDGFEISVIVEKLRSGLQASSSDQAVYGLTNREAPPAAVAVDSRGVLKSAQATHLKNRVALKDIPHAAKIRLIDYSLQYLAVDQIGQTDSYSALDQVTEV